MKIFKTIMKFLGIGILFLILGTGIYLYTSGPNLPDEADKIITEVIKKPLPELIEGKNGICINRYP